MSTPEIRKYPRTPHLEGSRLQQGDEDLTQIKFSEIKGKHLVVEEKIDGANVAVSFSDTGELLLQSRGHYLRGGAREADYNLFKIWANTHYESFYKTLGTRYIMYGEWMYVTHAIYYDALPSYFMEFDIFDKERQVFLDTKSRKKITETMPVSSVPVLSEGTFNTKNELLALLGNSLYKTSHFQDSMKEACEIAHADMDTILKETDQSPLMEGLYIKVEEEGKVAFRLKFVRAGYRQIQEQDNENYFTKAKIHNKLSVPEEDIFRE